MKIVFDWTGTLIKNPAITEENARKLIRSLRGVGNEVIIASCSIDIEKQVQAHGFEVDRVIEKILLVRESDPDVYVDDDLHSLDAVQRLFRSCQCLYAAEIESLWKCIGGTIRLISHTHNQIWESP